MDPVVQIVMVDWVDSAGKSGWDDPINHQSLPPYRCRSVGLLVKDSDGILILAQSLTHAMDRYEPRMADSIAIPRAAVYEIKVLHRWKRG